MLQYRIRTVNDSDVIIMWHYCEHIEPILDQTKITLKKRFVEVLGYRAGVSWPSGIVYILYSLQGDCATCLSDKTQSSVSLFQQDHHFEGWENKLLPINRPHELHPTIIQRNTDGFNCQSLVRQNYDIFKIKRRPCTISYEISMRLCI